MRKLLGMIYICILLAFAQNANAAFSIVVGPISSSITKNSASISWSLSAPGTGQVKYGVSTAYSELSNFDSALSLRHSQNITNLLPGTTYHFRVVSRNSSGVYVTSSDKTFKTADIPLTIIDGPTAVVNSDSAKVSWSLSKPATGQVLYGASTAYGKSTTLESSFDYSSHAQYISNLLPGIYHYKVVSKDQLGKTVSSTDKTFTIIGLYTYSWVTGSWSACSATACGSNGIQTRSVVCTRNDGVASADSNCTATKPAASQPCSTPPCVGFVPPERAHGSASVNVKDFGALGNGVADDTAAIQKAINSLPSTGGTVNIPQGVYEINSLAVYDSGTTSHSGIHLRSNMLLKLDPNAVLKAIPNDELKGNFIILAQLVHDVEISGGQIVGERDEHIGVDGEYGHGVMFRGAQRVTIKGTKISKNWGDGICLGAYKRTPVTYADDIVIYDVISTENRRQGLSIGNATNIKVYNSEFSKTEGTAPQFGIDIEPDNFDTVLNYAKNIEIVNCNISNNKGGGVQFYNRTSNILLKGNKISYNGIGVYTYNSSGSSINENLISHNRHKGTVFQSLSDNISTSKNIYRNNNTSQYGITNDTNPLVTITGLLDGTGGNGTTPHVGIATDAGTINILTNQYAK